MATFIIAEAGVNHNGDVKTAKKLIDAAVEAGCDAIKFQTFKAEKLVTLTAEKAQYQIKNFRSNGSQYEMLKKLELTADDFISLRGYCLNKGIRFMSTPFDEESSDFLDSIGLEVYKLPSGEITNKTFLQHVARKGKPIILSTGMSSLGEIEEALQWIHSVGNNDITLLHCTSNYPTDFKDVNLKAMLTIKNVFNTKVGYSDHTLGIEVPIAAVALGAETIEKHFTLDRNMDGPDHKASLEPQELKQMVEGIRRIEEAIGDGNKSIQHCELDVRNVARKSIVALADIRKGTKITNEMVGLRRPGTGLAPKYIDLIENMIAAEDFSVGHIFQFGDFYKER